jgi:hypothetical protein
VLVPPWNIQTRAHVLNIFISRFCSSRFFKNKMFQTRLAIKRTLNKRSAIVSKRLQQSTVTYRDCGLLGCSTTHKTTIHTFKDKTLNHIKLITFQFLRVLYTKWTREMYTGEAVSDRLSATFICELAQYT